MSAPRLEWTHGSERLGVLEASVGAYQMEVEPDDDTCAWQVWSGPDDDYETGNDPTIEQAQCAAELFALEHARKTVAALDKPSVVADRREIPDADGAL